jgi:hypothetical protein
MAIERRENVKTSELPKEPWSVEGAPDGALIRWLSQDDETGAVTALVDLPAGWKRPGAATNQAGQEFFVLEGALGIGDDLLTNGCYCYYPPGVVQREWRTDEDCCLLAIFHQAPAFTKSERSAHGAREDQAIPYLDSWQMEWIDPLKASDPTEPFRAGVFVKVLRVDEETGSSTHLAGLMPGWFALGVEVHPVWEENFTLCGDVHIAEIDGEPGYTMTKGSYFIRPAGIPHGPLATKSGNVNLVHTPGRLGINYQNDAKAEALVRDHFKTFSWR